MHICTKNTSYLYGRIVGRSIFHGSYYGLAFFSTENTSLRFFPMLFFDRGNFMYPIFFSVLIMKTCYLSATNLALQPYLLLMIGETTAIYKNTSYEKG